MMNLLCTTLALVALMAVSVPASADDKQTPPQPFLSPVFGNSMVLQRDRKDALWGWTEPGKQVSVTIAHAASSATTGENSSQASSHSSSQTVTVTADAQGKWMAHIGPHKAGGPYTITVAGPQTVVLSDILFGDVWICSGQSNMEMGIGNVTNADQEIAEANYPLIRLYTVSHHVAVEPQTIPQGEWLVCSPQTVHHGGWNGFSAVGYFFGRTLYQNLKVPIGLIHTSWGGTIAEAWTSKEALTAMPDFLTALSHVDTMRAGQQKFDANNPNVTTVLYNGMIAPLIPYGIKGAIWYQGESNAGRAYQYRTLLPTMIKDWRSRWGEGDFPFFVVQLANFTPTQPQPGESDWAELREAQLMTTQSLPNSGLAVIIDIGDAADIHPKDKQDVGKRLALNALAIAYHEKLVYSGPSYRAMKQEGNAIHLTFSHAGMGLVAKGGEKLQGFAIAGDDKHFVWADATINGNTIVVSSPQVPHPVAVRYAWAHNPVCNLYNKEGLPASPFRTDTWPGVTVHNK